MSSKDRKIRHPIVKMMAIKKRKDRLWKKEKKKKSSQTNDR